MSAHLFALLTRLHGLLAVLSLAVLVHPLITLWRRRGVSLWTARTADLAAVGLTLTFALGWWIYGDYRSHVKPGLLFDYPTAASLFESKEHLALVVAASAVGGALCLRTAGRLEAGRRTAWALLLCSLLIGCLVSALGLYVAATAHPGWGG